MHFEQFFTAVVIFIMITGLISVFAYFNNIRVQSKIEAGQVASINIYDGSTGKQFTITGRESISHIVDNLNSRTFYRDLSSKNYGEFFYTASFLNKSGKSVFYCTINSKDSMIYNNYFYKDPSSGIDFEYIKRLLENEVSE